MMNPTSRINTRDVFDGNGKYLPIREFQLNTIKPNSTILLIGGRGSGKSRICRDIIDKLRDIPVGAIICPTEKVDPFFSKFFPDTYIHDKYTPELISKIQERQQIMVDKLEEKKKQGKKFDPRILVIMDDCLSSKNSWVRDEKFMDLLYNGRHYNITFILTIQYPVGIPPDIRMNFDYIFLMRTDQVSNKKKIFDHYGGVLPDYNSFDSIYTQLTQNYGSMVITRNQSSDYTKKIFYYKSKMFVPKLVGCKEFVKYHDKNYNPQWKRRMKKFDIVDFCNKKKQDKSIIKIEKVDPHGRPIYD